MLTKDHTAIKVIPEIYPSELLSLQSEVCQVTPFTSHQIFCPPDVLPSVQRMSSKLYIESR